MTEQDKRDALAWLEQKTDMKTAPFDWRPHAHTIKALLAEPRMPEEPNADALEAMRKAVISTPIDDEGRSAVIEAVYAALHAHLSKPKKMKPVFHLYGSDRNGSPHRTSTPINADWHDINQAITALHNDGYEVVTVRREMVPE